MAQLRRRIFFFFFFLLKRAKGGCLFDWLVDAGGFTEDRIAIVMKQMFEAVAYLHSVGIVHRDIKVRAEHCPDHVNLS